MSRKKSALGIFIGLSARIGKIRNIKGKLTQSEFAKILGVAQGTINKYENGAILPGEDILKKIANYGGVTVEWLLHGDAPEPAAAEITEIPEAITIESPPPGAGAGLHDPYLYGRVDTGALTRIIELVEELLRSRKRPLKPVRFALLLSLLYDHFQNTGQIPDQATVKEFLRRVD
jgi:transcriptional regulator with XRE-family HTH domain